MTTSIHQRFRRCAKGGVWRRVFEALSADADDEYAALNATIVRAYQHSAGWRKVGAGDEAIGRSRGRLSTKSHAVVDVLGNPTAFFLTGGQASYLADADAPLAGIAAPMVIADRGYDAEARVLANLRETGETTAVSPRRNRKEQRGMTGTSTARGTWSRFSSAS